MFYLYRFDSNSLSSYINARTLTEDRRNQQYPLIIRDIARSLLRENRNCVAINITPTLSLNIVNISFITAMEFADLNSRGDVTTVNSDNHELWMQLLVLACFKFYFNRMPNGNVSIGTNGSFDTTVNSIVSTEIRSLSYAFTWLIGATATDRYKLQLLYCMCVPNIQAATLMCVASSVGIIGTSSVLNIARHVESKIVNPRWDLCRQFINGVVASISNSESLVGNTFHSYCLTLKNLVARSYDIAGSEVVRNVGSLNNTTLSGTDYYLRRVLDYLGTSVINWYDRLEAPSALARNHKDAYIETLEAFRDYINTHGFYSSRVFRYDVTGALPVYSIQPNNNELQGEATLSSTNAQPEFVSYFEGPIAMAYKQSKSEKPKEYEIDGKKYKPEECVIVGMNVFLKTDPRIAIDTRDEYVTLHKSKVAQIRESNPGIRNVRQVRALDEEIAISWDNSPSSKPSKSVEKEVRYRLKREMFAVVIDVVKDEPVIIYTSEAGANFVPLNLTNAKSIDCLQLMVVNYEFGLKHYLEDVMSSSFTDNKKFFKKSPVVWKRKADEYKSPHDGIASTSQTFIKTEGKQYKFGLEIECSGGVLPLYYADYRKFDVSCVFDGSLRMQDNDNNCGEYVTGVLCGDTGLFHVHQLVTALSKRCKVNKKCSVHIHVSGMNINQEFTVNLYRLLMVLEAPLFAMMPPSRANNPYCGFMQKLKMNIDYNSPSLEVDIREAYQEIIKTTAMLSKLQKGFSKESDHPKGYHCGYDRSSPRYWWANFVPMLFNIRRNGVYTMELRNHSGSLNHRKIENWILIVLGIIWYAENMQKHISSKTTLTSVLMAAYPKAGKYLSDYVAARTALFNGSKSTSSGENEENNDYEDNNNKELSRKEIVCAY